MIDYKTCNRCGDECHPSADLCAICECERGDDAVLAADQEDC